MFGLDRWSCRGGGCLRGVVGHGGSTVLALYTGNPSLELECLM